MSNATKAGKKYQNLNLSHISHQECRSEPYSFSTDIWKLMCLLYQMLLGEPSSLDGVPSLLFAVQGNPHKMGHSCQRNYNSGVSESEE